jgi:hypothetical protein
MIYKHQISGRLRISVRQRQKRRNQDKDLDKHWPSEKRKLT